MPDVFLSYSREDQATARLFAGCLEREGFSVWWDQTLRSGEAYDRVTEQALAQARAVAVLWSRASVESRWVRAEATQADRNGTLVPAMIEPCKRPIMFELTQTAELGHWKGDVADPAWRAYVDDIRRFVGRPAGDARTGVTGTASHAVSQATAAPARHAARRLNGKWIAAIAVASFAALVLLLAWPRLRDGPTPATTSATQTAPVTLAVLPFADLSPAQDQEYFSDGLTEEILNELAQNPGLRVTGRTSSFSFKGRNEDLRVIGQKLGVAHLLEGSIRKEGNELRITAQLIDSSDGAHRWSRSYTKQLSSVFALQEEIAKDVAQALSVSLDVGKVSRARGGTTHVEAYEKYLRARQLEVQEGRAEALQAAQLLREAVELDPQFALAWTALAFLLEFSLERDPDNPAALLRERDAAEARVFALAPDSPGAQQLRIVGLMRERRWLEAERLAQESGVLLTEVLMRVGRMHESVPGMERLRLEDPLALAASTNLQIQYQTIGKLELADAEYQRSKALIGQHGRSEHYALFRLLGSTTADPVQVDAQFRTFLANSPLPMKLDRMLAERWRDQQAARAAIREALEQPENQHPTRLLIIVLYADIFGDRQTALNALRRYAAGDPFWYTVPVIWHSYRTGLRADPQFKEVLRELKLVDYFRASGNWGDFCRPVGENDFECR